MFDPYARDTPGVSDPANDIFLIEPSDTEGLVKGVKALRIWNPTEEDATISVTTKGDTTLTLSVPAGSLWIEPIRVIAVKSTGTTEGVVIHGYTD